MLWFIYYKTKKNVLLTITTVFIIALILIKGDFTLDGNPFYILKIQCPPNYFFLENIG
jgi:hypothetical protein